MSCDEGRELLIKYRYKYNYYNNISNPCLYIAEYIAIGRLFYMQVHNNKQVKIIKFSNCKKRRRNNTLICRLNQGGKNSFEPYLFDKFNAVSSFNLNYLIDGSTFI